MFSPEDIKARLKKAPFVPVRIVSTSGQAYDVRHPDLVMVGKRFLIIGTPSHDNPGIFDGENHLAVLHVADMQDLPTPAAAPENGQA